MPDAIVPWHPYQRTLDQPESPGAIMLGDWRPQPAIFLLRLRVGNSSPQNDPVTFHQLLLFACSVREACLREPASRIATILHGAGSAPVAERVV